MRLLEKRLAVIVPMQSSGPKTNVSKPRSVGANIMVARDVQRPVTDNRDEVQAARAFVERMNGRAVHVGTTETGSIMPHPIYWAGNGLTSHGLSDRKVQAELAIMYEQQTKFMEHIHPILRRTADAVTVREGSSAVIDALPEKEQGAARAWSQTGIWPKLMVMLIEEGERRSRRELKRWTEAHDRNEGSRFASAASAEIQLAKWPVEFDNAQRLALQADARRHRANLVMQQGAAIQNGIG